MYEIETSLDINAPRERVWDVLTAFREWDEWNPIITRMRATLSPGTPLSFIIAVGGRELKIKAQMVKVEHGKELRWRGPPSWLVGRVLRGEHYLAVESSGASKSRLVHGEQFAGVSLPMFWGKLRSELELAYSRMNRAIKARAESAAGASAGSSPSMRP
jgi:hypothetical protein